MITALLEMGEGPKSSTPHIRSFKGASKGPDLVGPRTPAGGGRQGQGERDGQGYRASLALV